MFTPEGTYIGEYKGQGVDIKCPAGIAVDPEGYVFVSEYNSTSSRLLVFDPQRQLVNTIQGFNYGVGVVLDKDGYVFVCDYNNSCVKKF